MRLSQYELAELANVSVQTISRAENGQRELGSQNASRIAAALEMSTDYLLTGIRNDIDLYYLELKIKSLPDHAYRHLEKIIRTFMEMSKEEPKSSIEQR